MSASSSAPPISLSPALADALRQGTHALHRRAERSGVVWEIIQGRVDRRRYTLYMRNLLPVYQAMERGLDRLIKAPGVGRLARRPLYRSVALEADLTTLAGADWCRTVPLLSVGEQYARRVAAAAENGGVRLIAHAYARYMGDLNGGQIMKQRLLRSLNLPHSGLAFYDFPDIADPVGFGAEYRAEIDLAGSEIADIAAVIDEAAVVFELNIQLSEAVQKTPGP